MNASNFSKGINIVNIKRILLASVILSTVAFVASLLAPATALVQPSIEGGDIYRVANLTKGTAFTDPNTADKCDVLQYRVRIHNPGPDEGLTGVVVKAVLPAAASTQNVSSVTVSASNASPSSVSDTATVNLSTAQKVTYVAGSTQLLDANGAAIGTIGDVTSGAGVNIGNVGISVNEKRFVQFKAKVDCPETPPPPVKNFACSALNVVKIDRTHFKFTAVATVQNVVIQNYVFTAKNAAGATVDTSTVTTGATSADYNFTTATPGTYTITAVINTDAGATNPETCKKTITIEKEQEENKKFECKALDVVTIDRTHFKFTARAAVTNVTIQSYVFTAMNSSNATVDTKTVTTGATSADYDFTSNTPGTYTISAVVKTSAGETTPDKCRKQVTIVEEGKPVPPPVTPTTPETPVTPAVVETPVAVAVTPTELPATGPADLTAVFALVSTISGLAYFFITKRTI